MTNDHIVISGMAIEAPGGVQTPAAYWTALSESRELIGPLPRDRGWPLDDMLSLSRIDGWADVCDAGGFLDDPGAFDPVFFNIGQLEATVTSPQIRLAMRVAWKALENSGINPAALDEEEAGCFVGSYPTEYGPIGTEPDEYSGYRTVGIVTDSIAGRVSHSPWLGRSVGHRQHRLRLIADGSAYGRGRGSQQRMRLGTGRRCVRDGHPGDHLRLRQTQCPCRRRALPRLRRRRQRNAVG